MATADGYVLPKPGVPKTLGILNVIFGVLLVLLGICGLGSLLAAPALFNVIEKTAKEAQEKVEAGQKANIKGFDDRIATAKTDEEKQAIEQERANAVANQPKMAKVDLSAATDAFKDPKVMGVNYAGAISGLILHVVLLISGIGLIRLTAWGRSLGVWWSVLMIAQVLALLVATIFIALPANQVNTDKQIANLEAQAKAEGAGQAEATALNMTKSMSAMAAPLAIGQSLSGLIYPIILLVLLTRPATRAACQSRKPRNIDDI